MGKGSLTGRKVLPPPKPKKPMPKPTPKKPQTPLEKTRRLVEEASDILADSGYSKKEIKYWQKLMQRALRSGVVIMDKGSYYNSSTGEIAFKEGSSKRTIYHEFGHMLDYTKGQRKISEVTDNYFAGSRAFKEDLAHLAKEIGFTLNKSGTGITGTARDNSLIFARWWKGKKLHQKNVFSAGAFSDIVSAMTKESAGATYVGGGHSRDYWNIPKERGGQRQSLEVFAQYVALRHTGGGDFMTEFKNLTPNLYRILQKRYKREWK